MNFIDAVMKRLDIMSADDVIQEIGGSIYDNPAVRKELHKYPQFIQDIIFIVDLDTALNMDGDVLVNNENDIPNMITALQNIHANNDASILQKIYDTYRANPNYDAIFKAIDGMYEKMYLYTGFDIWPLLETYVDKEMHANKHYQY